MIRTTIGVLLFCALACSAGFGQTTLNVPSTTYPTVQSAINAAVDGDTVQIAAGTYNENLVIVGKHLTVSGAGTGMTILDGGGLGPVVALDLMHAGTTRFEQLDIVGGDTVAAFTTGLNTPMSYVVQLDSVRLKNNDGRAIFGWSPVSFEIEDCEIRDNIAVGTASPTLEIQGFLTMLRTRVIDNQGPTTGPMFSITSTGPIAFADCEFSGNVASGFLLTAWTPGPVTIERCRFAGNTYASNRPLMNLVSGTAGLLTDTAILDNQGDTGPIIALFNSWTVARCTLAGNTSSPTTPGAAITLSGSGPAALDSCIIAGNDDDSFIIAGGTLPSAQTSLIKGGFQLSPLATVSNPGQPGLVGLDAAYRDPAAGDYRLLPGSPCVDAVAPDASTPALDLDGAPRVVGAGLDMGCFELQTQDPGPAYTGTSASGDVLKFNGSAGGPTRSITVDAGSIGTVSVDSPTMGSFSPFIIWGYLGVPAPTEAFDIGFAGGQMAFLPHLLGIGDLRLFTFTNNLLIPNSGLVASTPAPWSASGPCAPFPVTMTLQGLIADGAGPLRITNAITLHAR